MQQPILSLILWRSPSHKRRICSWEAQLSAWKQRPPHLLAADKQATSLSAGLAKAAIRAMMPFSFHTPNASPAQKSIHPAKRLKQLISRWLSSFPIFAPIPVQRLTPLVSVQQP